MELDEKSLRTILKERGMYVRCPELNETIHLSCKGIRRIQNLERFTGLKVLYLDGNAISKIENLQGQKDLIALYLSGNLISRIENLSAMSKLEVLDLSCNRLASLRGFPKLISLKILCLSKNRLKQRQDIEELTCCISLSSLDISYNCFETCYDLEPLGSLSLSLLRTEGNPLAEAPEPCREQLLQVLGHQLKGLDGVPTSTG